ncbi:PASTA domain-containing protein [Porphyromonas sp.]
MSLLKKDSLLTHLLIMAGVSLLLIVLLIFGLDLYTHHGETVKVPDLRGKTLAEMQRILDDVGLEYEINDSTYSNTAIPGTVREVVPAPGSEVKSGRIIFIAINGFHQRLQTIPIYKDQSARQILSLLKGLGFESVEQRVVAGRYSGSVVKLETADGKLVEAGTQLRIDTKLILFVAGQAIDTLGLDRYIEDYSKGGSDSTAGSTTSPDKKDDGGISNDWW